MLELLRSLEWCAPFVALPHTNCPACGRRRENGHAPDCRLDRAIRGAVSVEPLRPPLTTEEKARALGYARNASAWVDADGVWCSDALIDVRWTEHLIRGQQRAREAASEPTVDEMARDVRPTFADKLRALGLPTERDEHGDYNRGMAVYASLQARGLSAGVRWLYWTAGSNMPDDRRWPTAEAAVDELYAEWVAKQQAALGARPGSPPTDPSALAAWLYARVVPGQTRAVAGSEEFVVLTKATHRTGGFTVAGARAEPASYPAHAMRRPITRLLNPDGTVLWEAK